MKPLRVGKGKQWAKDIKRKYHLTVEQYEALIRKQGGVCAVCKRHTGKHLHVDHDHATGKVRGLLCPTCNSALGHAKDSVSILEGLIKYLRDCVGP